MNDFFIDKSVISSIYVLIADYFLYYEHGYYHIFYDSLLFGFNYLLTSNIFNIIFSKISKSYIYDLIISSLINFVLYFKTYKYIFKDDILNSPNNDYYKTWYVMLFWIISIKCINDIILDKSLSKFNKKLKNNFSIIDKQQIFDFIDNNYDKSLKLPKFLPKSENTLPIDSLNFLEEIKSIDLFRIEITLNNLYQIITNKDNSNISLNNKNELELLEYINIMKHNFKTYYHRVFIPFTNNTLQLSDAVINLSWNILGYFKNYLPEEAHNANDIIFIYNSFMYGIDMANDNITYYDKAMKTFKFAYNNLLDWLPYYNEINTLHSSVDAGIKFNEFSKYFKEFIKDTNEFVEKCKLGERYVKFVITKPPELPKYKKFLDKNKYK